jgi:hypothetical protein
VIRVASRIAATVKGGDLNQLDTQSRTHRCGGFRVLFKARRDVATVEQSKFHI